MSTSVGLKRRWVCAHLQVFCDTAYLSGAIIGANTGTMSFEQLLKVMQTGKHGERTVDMRPFDIATFHVSAMTLVNDDMEVRYAW